MGTATASLLSHPTYALSEAARLLQVAPSTLHWWLEGGDRGGIWYPPVLRPEPLGTSQLTWGEFVEAGLLREYRVDLPLQKLRPLIEALRLELSTPYPLATARPMVSGRELVWNLQQACDLPEELWIVVGKQQLVLGAAASAFFKRVEFDPHTAEAERYIVMPGPRPVVVDPQVAFGAATIQRVRAEVLAELAESGEPIGAVVEIYQDYGITSEDVATALAFVRAFLPSAA